jgi:hypothetical protein
MPDRPPSKVIAPLGLLLALHAGTTGAARAAAGAGDDRSAESAEEVGLEDDASAGDEAWTEAFGVAPGDLAPTGRNPFFILEPGYTLVLENERERLTITVLDETEVVADVETRVVEERETRDGELVEVSRNFFAISRRTNSVFYFGEEVDVYDEGAVVHEGAWRAGEDGARFGLIMPGEPLLGARHYQEIAPDVAMDRAEVVALDEAVETSAGAFSGCLVVEETTPLEPDEREYKVYAPGVGLILDGSLELVQHGAAGR